MKEEAVYAGIDVSRDSLDVAVRPGGASWKAQNSVEGIRELIKRLKEARVSLVVAEATGGFEVPMVSFLAFAIHPCPHHRRHRNDYTRHDVSCITGAYWATNRSHPLITDCVYSDGIRTCNQGNLAFVIC